MGVVSLYKFANDAGVSVKIKHFCSKDSTEVKVDIQEYEFLRLGEYRQAGLKRTNCVLKFDAKFKKSS